MDNKRPLVWLSADFPSRLMSPDALPGWHLLPVRVLDHPLPPAPGEGPWPVGVCLLAGLGNESLERVAAWLETLPVSAWLALITPEQRTRSRICRLIRDYCQDFHTLPPDLRRLELSLGHLWGMQALTAPYATTHATGPHTQPAGHATRVSGQDTVATDGPDPLAGRSPAITRARALMRRLAATDERVLIYGEPGTGRGAVARFLHRHSPRRHGPLVVINCAALPESLTQSELFGHERGAFTHALNAREGRILAANGGTLVLAGLDELSLAQQSALLRFLEDGHIEPVGALRIKAPTGEGPYDVDRRTLRDSQGNPIGVELSERPTGSGTWAYEPGVTMIYPSDPAVLFANLSYVWTQEEDEGIENGGVVDPGDVIRFGFGMGFAFNERTSFSLSYDHSIIQKTDIQYGNDLLDATFDRLQVGTLSFGLSQRLTADTSLSLSVGVGVTESAPSTEITLRVPINL